MTDDLRAPWVRWQLLEHLWSLTEGPELGAAGLHAVRVFFAETGLLADPMARVGFVLRDPGEAAVLAVLDVELSKVLDAGAPLPPEGWLGVRSAALRALERLS